MATVKILVNSDNSPCSYSDQGVREVHLFSDSNPNRSVGWKKFRVGNPYEVDGNKFYPFFIDLDEVRDKGWRRVAIHAGSNPPTSPVFQVWFSDSEINFLGNGSSEYLECISLSVPMVSIDQQREINEKYRDRILQVARDLFFPDER